MKDREKAGVPKLFAGTNLVREVSYLHEDEARALALRARKERASKAEIIRRALRAYLGIEDRGAVL
jgi:Ribbon-helix-helix protein, copG family